MRRRDLITMLGGAAAAALGPSSARAEQSKIPRLGYLYVGMPPLNPAFWRAMRELGYSEGENILTYLDQAGICVSTGSACHSTTRESSPTLRAMNVPYTAAQGSIRFSLGRYNTEEEIKITLNALPKIIAKLVEMSPYEKELQTIYKARSTAQ